MHNSYYEKIGNSVKNIDNEIPFQIPKNWTWVRLKTICEVRNGFTPRRENKDFWDSGTIPWFTIEDKRNQGMYINYTEQHITQAAVTKNRIVPAKSVLLCCTASLGEVAFTNIPITTNQQFNGITIKSDFLNAVHSLYLLVYARTLDKTLNNSLASATTFGFVSVSKIESLLMPIPPFNEQLKIYELINKVDQYLSDIEKNYKDIEKNITLVKRRILNEIFCENSSYKSYYPKKFKLGEILIYEQPGPYIVTSTKYHDKYQTPVLTPGKSYILGYTNEKDGIYKVKDKVIIFDDFTTSSRLIDFDFKVKSSAMKILTISNNILFDINYMFYLLQTINILSDTHKRFWISEYSNLIFNIHILEEQKRIVEFIEKANKLLDSII